MLDFHEKRRLKGIVFSKPFIGGLFILGLLISLSAYERYQAEQETMKKRDERVAELDRLKQKASALEAKVERLESERGIEGAIREQYDIAKENETVVVIVGDEKKEKNPNVRPLPQRDSWGARFFSWLKFW